MLKQHKKIAFIFGLFFLLTLQKFATPLPIFRYLVPAFLILSAAVLAYSHWYLKQIQKYNFWALLRLAILLISAFGIFLVLPSAFVRGVFLIIMVFVLMLFLMILGNQAENVSLNETLVIAFGLFFGFFAAFHYAPAYQPLYLLGIFFATSLLSRSFYQALPKPDQTRLLGSLILGFFCSQVFWALNFLPFHFSALSLFLFNIFYFCLIMNYYHLFHVLNFKKLQFHLMILVICDAVVFLTTPWRVLK